MRTTGFWQCGSRQLSLIGSIRWTPVILNILLGFWAHFVAKVGPPLLTVPVHLEWITAHLFLTPQYFKGFQNLAQSKVKGIFVTYLKQNRRELFSSFFVHPLKPKNMIDLAYEGCIPHANEAQLRVESCNTTLPSQCPPTKGMNSVGVCQKEQYLICSSVTVVVFFFWFTHSSLTIHVHILDMTVVSADFFCCTTY